MSLFQCARCGCVENTALSAQGFMGRSNHLFNWKGKEDYPRPLCSACGPTQFINGKPTKFGKWHGVFKRDFLPIDQYITNDKGDIVHIENGLEPTQEDYISPPSFIEEE